MTPRQISAYAYLAMKQRSLDRAETIASYAMGSRADGKDLKAELKALTDDGQQG